MNMQYFVVMFLKFQEFAIQLEALTIAKLTNPKKDKLSKTQEARKFF